jgi:hypothetical protein
LIIIENDTKCLVLCISVDAYTKGEEPLPIRTITISVTMEEPVCATFKYGHGAASVETVIQMFMYDFPIGFICRASGEKSPKYTLRLM